MHWTVMVHKDEGSSFGVTVPDLPGCFSAGNSLEEALEQAKEAIELHLEAMLEDGEAIPMPRKRSEYPGDTDAIYALVEIDDRLVDGVTERINLTIPSWANSQIERYAKRTGNSKSGLMWRATLDQIQRETTPTID
ncbi:type II toxin-antitoxin system HicB family antitoxin [Picosynechococcus sp. PCC 7117]|uniref:type II toxin-antitoxin system HicB family antitoxin n=1 Tax=Picosynechococcus sp. PCC 7117 TaxID=195498 RepID=UPI0008106996|nr:type II toxin-antitoxin system HicB family antitoxin [Picosynechococcus sp. PCC 7117]ANV88894.1 hypothetical protein AWQ22_14900 [Picosynechococcus sp. PCC 7117]